MCFLGCWGFVCLVLIFVDFFEEVGTSIEKSFGLHKPIAREGDEKMLRMLGVMGFFCWCGGFGGFFVWLVYVCCFMFMLLWLVYAQVF